jgi:hypothetical protein
MNSQCNGSFAQNQRADAGGNRRVLNQSLFMLSGFWDGAPLSPQNAHAGPRWANGWPIEPVFRSWRPPKPGQTVRFTSKTQDLRRFYDE